MATIGLSKGSGKRLKVREKSVIFLLRFLDSLARISLAKS